MTATRIRPLIAALLLAGLAPGWAWAIDFETLPGGAPTVDQQSISNEYLLSDGVTFALVTPGTLTVIGSPLIAKAGPALNAFAACWGDDTAAPSQGVGSSFLTDDTGLGVSTDLLIRYSTPVAQASGVLLDTDCRDYAFLACEQWKIIARDSSDIALQTIWVDAPELPSDPACVDPNGYGDAKGITWSFSRASADIASVTLSYTGTATNVGIAFDNFSPASIPGPPSIDVSASYEEICLGQSVDLTALVSGGFLPFTYQWQEETSPGSWANLGTGPLQEVSPQTSTRYRVTVTDALTQVVTSPPLLVTVLYAPQEPLCEGPLLISNYAGDDISSYSFFNGAVQTFVSAGGSLNGPSDATCGPDDNLYVSSQASHQVLRYNGLTGSFIDVFVSAGSGGLNFPTGLAFGPDGNLYVASVGQDTVNRYNGTTGSSLGTFVSAGLGGLVDPAGLMFRPNGDLLVASNANHRVLEYDGSSGASLGDFVSAGLGGLASPRGLTFGPDDNLYVGEQTNDSVRRYNGTTGDFIDVFVSTGSGGLDRANDVLFGPDGDLYVASYNNDRLQLYQGATGTFDSIAADSSDGLSGPGWLTLQCQAPTLTLLPVLSAPLSVLLAGLLLTAAVLSRRLGWAKRGD